MLNFIFKVNSFAPIGLLFIILVIIVVPIEGVPLVALAISLSILGSAPKAELIAAPACHVIATLVFLHPELAAGALLHFGSSHERQELLVVIGHIFVHLMLFAGLSFVKLCFAAETVLFLAARASIGGEVIFESEDCLAARSRAPVSILAVFLHELVQAELIVLLEQLPGDVLLEVDHNDFGIAPCLRARNRQLFICYSLFEVLDQAGFVKVMAAGNRTNCLQSYFTYADRTFHSNASNGLFFHERARNFLFFLYLPLHVQHALAEFLQLLFGQHRISYVALEILSLDMTIIFYQIGEEHLN